MRSTKKLPFVFLLLLSCQCFAQTFGVKTGLALSKYAATYRVNTDPNVLSPTIEVHSFMPGFLFGGYAEMRLQKSWYLRTGAEIVVKGAREKFTSSNNGDPFSTYSNPDFTTLDIPVNLVYKTGEPEKQRWVIGGGFVPGLILSKGYRKHDLGLALFAGYEFPIGLNMNVNYTHGLVNIANPDFSWYRSLRNRYLGFTIGYFF